jgi:hypothetical protein
MTQGLKKIPLRYQADKSLQYPQGTREEEIAPDNPGSQFPTQEQHPHTLAEPEEGTILGASFAAS